MIFSFLPMPSEGECTTPPRPEARRAMLNHEKGGYLA